MLLGQSHDLDRLLVYKREGFWEMKDHDCLGFLSIGQFHCWPDGDDRYVMCCFLRIIYKALLSLYSIIVERKMLKYTINNFVYQYYFRNSARVSLNEHNKFVPVITRSRSWDAGSPARHQQSASSIPITVPDHGFQNKQRYNRVCCWERRGSTDWELRTKVMHRPWARTSRGRRAGGVGVDKQSVRWASRPAAARKRILGAGIYRTTIITIIELE